MSYWKAKKELQFIEDYRTTVIQFWNVEDEVDEIVGQSMFPRNYMPREEGLRISQATEEPRRRRDELRERLAKDNQRAIRIANKLLVPILVTSTPAPAVGGRIVQFYLFDAILRDPSYGAVIGQGVDRQSILDGINATIGMCEDRVKIEWSHLINPFYWIKALFIFILRLPVNLIGLAGFDISKFEEHFWGKLFNLLWIAALIGFLVLLGLGRGDLIELVKKIITKG